MISVKRALLSCSDKTGLDEFANGLAALGIELIASGGTAAYLRDRKLRVTTVEAFTGAEEQLDGRVKTLHPKIFGGILARRDDPSHMRASGGHLIDLVVVNLYPFEQTVAKPGISLDEAIEQIDVGGVALLRAAAKNFRFVAVVSAPGQYRDLLAALQRDRGGLSEDAGRALAAEALRLTSGYDRAIAGFLEKPSATLGSLPDTIDLTALKRQPLRYGENPHQAAGWYVPKASPAAGLASLVQRQGKDLSYNNLLDLDAAVRCVAEFDDPACAIVKHVAPCGVACAASAHEAYARALKADEESAFGGIVAINRPLDAATAKAMSGLFLEVIVAPSIEPAAAQALAKKTNLRLIELADPQRGASPIAWRSILGGWLAQEEDLTGLDPASQRVATGQQPTEGQWRDLRFAWTVAKHARSNAIVIADDRVTIAIGQGQPSRVRAVRQALHLAGARARGAVLASDGFFPFPDSVEAAAQAGIAAIIQPGGSIKDPDVIAAAERAKIPLVLTNIRHFRH